jgi:nitrile hydratase accessory protein
VKDRVDPAIAAMEGASALPRKNGEIVFEAPWQGRAFGLGVALCRSGLYDWSEFQRSLIETIAADPMGKRGYYEQWVAALEKLLLEKKLLSAGEIEHRAAELRAGEPLR